MNKRDTRSISSIQSAHANAKNYLPPVVDLGPEAEQIYASLLGSIPSAERVHTSVRALVGEAAQAMLAIEQADKHIVDYGQIQTDDKGIMRPNPSVAIRHAASMRLQSLFLRLKVLPQADQRELRRAATYESEARGHATLRPPVAIPDGPAPDWGKLLKEEKARKNGTR